MMPTPGIRESYLAMRARGSNKARSKVDELVVSRFYLTLVLSDLMSEKSVWDVAAKFALDRGFIQSLLQRCRPERSLVLDFIPNILSTFLRARPFPFFVLCCSTRYFRLIQIRPFYLLTILLPIF